MAKFLLVIAVVIVIYLLVRSSRKQGAAPASRTDADANDGKYGASRLGEDMVRCGVCGVHLPTSEAVASRGDYFCSKEHLQLAVRDRDNR